MDEQGVDGHIAGRDGDIRHEGQRRIINLGEVRPGGNLGAPAAQPDGESEWSGHQGEAAVATASDTAGVAAETEESRERAQERERDREPVPVGD